MKKFHTIFPTGAVLTVLLLAGCSQPKEVLKLKWVAGKCYREEVSMAQNNVVNMPGATAPMEQKINFTEGIAISVLKDRPGGGSELELKFTSQKIEATVNGQRMVYFDSSQDPKGDTNNPVSAMLRRLIGAQVKFLVDADGTVEKIDGFDAFMRRLAGDDAKSQNMLSGMFTENTLKQIIMRGQQLPGQPVKPGDEWSLHAELPAGHIGVLNRDLKCRLGGFEQHAGRRCAVIEYAGTLTSKPGSVPAGAGSFTVTDGVVRGRTWFDAALGMTMENISDQTMNITGDSQGQHTASHLQQKMGVRMTAVEDVGK